MPACAESIGPWLQRWTNDAKVPLQLPFRYIYYRESDGTESELRMEAGASDKQPVGDTRILKASLQIRAAILLFAARRFTMPSNPRAMR